MPKLSVIFTARERFSMADTALAALFAHCPQPFQLVVVDAGTPEPYRSRLLKSLEGRESVQIVRSAEYCLPNRARNLALEKATGDYILFLENDCMIRPGCVERLLAVAEELPGCIVVPWLWEKRDRHHDSSAIAIVEQPDGSLRILPETVPLEPGGKRQRIKFFEHHCFLITRAAQDKLGPADEELNTREAIDISVAAWRHEIPVILEPGAQVDFYAPPPIERAEQEYFHYRWDAARGDASHVRVSRRWNIKEMPDTYEFVREQMLRKSHVTWLAIRGRSLMRKLRDRLTGR